jgi:hypothetical protein
MSTPNGRPAEHHIASTAAATFVVGSILLLLALPTLLGWLADGINGFGALMRAAFGS